MKSVEIVPSRIPEWLMQAQRCQAQPDLRAVRLSHIASDSVLDAAYDWLCRSRKDSHPNADVWDLRWR